MKKLLLIDTTSSDGGVEKKTIVENDILTDIIGPDSVSAGAYNFLIGCFLIYGFLINIIECSVLSTIHLPKLPAFLGLLLYIFCALIGSFFVREKAGTLSLFIGYHFFVVPVGVSVWLATNGRYIGDIIESAGLTTAVTSMMLLASSMFPKFFSGLGRFLLVSLFSFVICELVSVFVFAYYSNIFHLIAVLLFSLYIGYDWYVGSVRRKCVANALRTALALYLDVINIFLALLRSKR